MFRISLPGWQRGLLYGIGACSSATGVGWLVLLAAGTAEDPYSGWREVQHALTMSHGVSSLLLAVLLGTLVPVHIRLGWRFRRHFVSGLLLSLSACVVVLSSIALYYAGSGTARGVAEWAHEISGGASIALFTAHWLVRARR